jgi:hypothetical protein
MVAAASVVAESVPANCHSPELALPLCSGARLRQHSFPPEQQSPTRLPFAELVVAARQRSVQGSQLLFAAVAQRRSARVAVRQALVVPLAATAAEPDEHQRQREPKPERAALLRLCKGDSSS